jgi:MbtH protein
MTSVFDREDIDFEVVLNHEEQYSIWPAYKEIPQGWKKAGKRGLKSDCLTFIEQEWTDMRPLSLRKHMAEQESKQSLLTPNKEVEDAELITG